MAMNTALPRIVAASALLLAWPAGSSEPLYIPTVHMLAADGTYHKYALTGTEAGVGRVECELRKDAWAEKFRDALEIAKRELAKSGKYGGTTITCERK